LGLALLASMRLAAKFARTTDAPVFARRQRLQHKARLWYDDRTEHLARNHDVQIHARVRNQDTAHKLKKQFHEESINPNQLGSRNQRACSPNHSVKLTMRALRSDFVSPPPALGGENFLRPPPATSSDGEGTIDAEWVFYNGPRLCKP